MVENLHHPQAGKLGNGVRGNDRRKSDLANSALIRIVRFLLVGRRLILVVVMKRAGVSVTAMTCSVVVGTIRMLAANVQHVSRRKYRKLYQSDARGDCDSNFCGKHGHQSIINSESDQIPKYTVGRVQPISELCRVLIFLTISCQ